ncbi:hypothetical protein ABBQ32_010393 [Trebouxia sp. C0010 RCD-2024]
MLLPLMPCNICDQHYLTHTPGVWFTNQEGTVDNLLHDNGQVLVLTGSVHQAAKPCTRSGLPCMARRLSSSAWAFTAASPSKGICFAAPATTPPSASSISALHHKTALSNTGRWTDTRADIWTDTTTARGTDTHTRIHTDRDTDRQTDRHSHRLTNKQTRTPRHTGQPNKHSRQCAASTQVTATSHSYC